jgi:carotenoid cleavage dioxygenase-like enzyme
LDKTAGVNICGSHPHYSESDGTTYNLGASFMSGLKYHVLKVPPMPEKSELIDGNNEPKAYKKASILATIPSSYSTSFSYTHSFAMTERYIIFLEQPLLVNGFKLATCTPKGKPLQECLEWCGDEPTRFHVIEKATGNQLKVKYQSEAFYHFHNINAYEDGNHIVLDVIAYNDASVLEKYELKRMRKGEWDNSCPPMARRYVLPLGDLEGAKQAENLVTLKYTDASAIKTDKGVIRMTPEQLAPPGFELPRINYKGFNGKKYRYIYGSGVFEMGYFANAICKIDLNTKKIELWRESPTAYPGEAVFVCKPGGTDEDEGVLVSLVLESDVSKPHFLLLLDAKNMKEIARATFPVKGVEIPTTIHGIFVPQ